MSDLTKPVIAVAAIVFLGLAASLLPIGAPQYTATKPIPNETIPSPAQTNPRSETTAPKPERTLFSNAGQDDDVGANIESGTPQAQEWSPFEYELIGVSGAGKRRTAWLKHKSSGALVSAKSGSKLGVWQVLSVGTLEAKVRSDEQDVSLKLFNGDKAR